ncbi:MAG: alpha/beta hydrolase family protein, partial [Anaerolineae bacterium]
FETVLAQTRVNGRKTAVYSLTAPGERFNWLETMIGELRCRIHVRPAVDPAAPLVMFHHGFNEMPYDGSWRRIFDHPDLANVHAVAIQAPFHDTYSQPTAEGLATVQNAYQMFAGSLRMMEIVQSCFEAEGVADTAVTGVSWGGVTSLLYEGVFQRTRAVIPLLSSPNLAQVMWDIVQLFNRPLTVSHEEIAQAFDFTSYYQRCDPDKVFPLLGEHDRFFQLEHHGNVFVTPPSRERPFTTIPDGHITGHMKTAGLRQHILDVLSQTVARPTSQESLNLNSG